jgi:hypothetical protein
MIAIDCGIEAVSLSESILAPFGRGFRPLGGVLDGLLKGDSVSDEVSGGVGNDCCAFFCLRASLLFKPARRLIASLLRYSVAVIFSGSATAGVKAVGLATCARVGALDILRRRNSRTDF